MSDANEILSALAAYNAAVADGSASEKEVDFLFDEAEALVPHAKLNDLYFYGECERSLEQIVEEALLRERLWEEQGNLAVLIHIHGQVQAAIQDPTLDEVYKDNALQTIKDINAEIENLKSGPDN